MSAMTPDDIARDLSLPRETVMRKLRDGSIPGRKVGRVWRTEPSAYQAWLRPTQQDPFGLEPMSNRSRANLRRKAS